MDALAVHVAIRHGALFALVRAPVPTHEAQETRGHLRGRGRGCQVRWNVRRKSRYALGVMCGQQLNMGQGDDLTDRLFDESCKILTVEEGGSDFGG